MTEASKGKLAAAGSKPAKKQVSPEQRRLVLATGRALWHVYHVGDEPKLDAEQRKTDWQENRKAYVQMASGLVKRLKAQGITLVQSAVPKTGAAKGAGTK